MPAHQCYATFVARQFYGTLSASMTEFGLISTGSQDNCNIYCRVDPAPTPWIRINGGDGGWNAFMADSGLLHNVMGQPVGAANVGPGPTVTDIGVVPIGPPPRDPTGIPEPVGDAVRRPTYRKPDGQTLYAMCGTGNDVRGCFSDKASGGPYYWELIATLPASVAISALGSFHGGTIHAGTANSRMFAVDSKQGTFLELPVVLPKSAGMMASPGGRPRWDCRAIRTVRT